MERGRLAAGFHPWEVDRPLTLEAARAAMALTLNSPRALSTSRATAGDAMP